MQAAHEAGRAEQAEAEAARDVSARCEDVQAMLDGGARAQ